MTLADSGKIAIPERKLTPRGIERIGQAAKEEEIYFDGDRRALIIKASKNQQRRGK